MTSFADTPEWYERLDFQILQNGWISTYWQPAILNNDLQWFNNNHFRVVDFDCANWKDEAIMHDEIKVKLDFPAYYGSNLNALNDCLCDIEIPNEGLVVVFKNFQHVAKQYAHDLLDIFANKARLHMLFGRKLLTLIQVDDPNFEIPAVGACPVSWNRKERLNSKRGM